MRLLQVVLWLFLVCLAAIVFPTIVVLGVAAFVIARAARWGWSR